jgi:hypothetical protein
MLSIDQVCRALQSQYDDRLWRLAEEARRCVEMVRTGQRPPPHLLRSWNEAHRIAAELREPDDPEHHDAE